MEDGKYRVFEFERLLKERFVRIDTKENYKEIYNTMKDLIFFECNVVQFDTCYYLEGSLPQTHKDYLTELFNIKEFTPAYHHISHAACSFYQSSFEEALVISYDGGGYDGGDGPDRVTFFNIYHAKRNGEIQRIKYIPYDLGTAYGLAALPISEIQKTEDSWGEKFLGFAGKIMGFCAYGQPRSTWIEPFKTFYRQHKHVSVIDLNKSLSTETGLNLGINTLSGEVAADFAATSQYAFEQIIFEEIAEALQNYNLPICLTGGCALNVILNQKLRDTLDVPIFVPPNPSDCGLALGMMVFNNPEPKAIDVMYSGFPILDLHDLANYVKKENAKLISTKELAKLIAEGKIVGLMRGNSEHGPRALGNRSILCDPSIAGMKDILNHKVKARESYRPFAPMVKLEDVNKYFHMSEDASFMSFAPKVREIWKSKIPAIVHEDGTARVQTITKEQNPYIYQLLSDFEEITGIGVILNTSFNIKGRPILTTIVDALEVLHTTELDACVIEDYLFDKEKP
jgi:carbamoyltransferase